MVDPVKILLNIFCGPSRVVDSLFSFIFWMNKYLLCAKHGVADMGGWLRLVGSSKL